jgi:hypothetical protein
MLAIAAGMKGVKIFRIERFVPRGGSWSENPQIRIPEKCRTVARAKLLGRQEE